MKSCLKPIAFCALFLVATTWANADTFLLGSYCTTAGCPVQPGIVNSPTVFGSFSATELTSAQATMAPAGATPTFYADPGSIWTPVGPFASPYSNYVSFQPGTGPGNFTNTSPAGFYNYYSTFTLTYLGSDPNPDPNQIIGILDVAADDTTDVWINGIQLTGEGALGNGTPCATGLPNCQVHLGLFLRQGDIQLGLNTLAFSVQQNNLYTGLDYDANFNIVPEPATWLLLATGLAPSTIAWWRTRKAKS